MYFQIAEEVGSLALDGKKKKNNPPPTKHKQHHFKAILQVFKILPWKGVSQDSSSTQTQHLTGPSAFARGLAS